MEADLSVIRKNYENIMRVIEQTCRRAGRDPSEVAVIAVTKQVSPDVIGLLTELGIAHIGENRIQSAAEKRPSVVGDFHWHMIGHLQTNKAGRAVELFDAVHSIDSERVARRLQACAAESGRKITIFLQFNTGGEPAKSGLSDRSEAERISGIIRRECPNLDLVGLMTMAPLTDDAGVIRSCFRKLRSNAEQMNLKALSMGMSNDYHIALEEGATHLRIGTALFDGVRGSWQN